MEFISTDKRVFKLDEVEKCKIKLEPIPNVRGGESSVITRYYVILKTGIEIPIFAKDYNPIENLLKSN